MKLYVVPTVAVVGGLPPIDGGLLAAAATVMVKGVSEADPVPSVTLITIFASLPMAGVPGVPESRPDAGSKLAHDG